MCLASPSGGGGIRRSPARRMTEGVSACLRAAKGRPYGGRALPHVRGRFVKRPYGDSAFRIAPRPPPSIPLSGVQGVKGRPPDAFQNRHR